MLGDRCPGECTGVEVRLKNGVLGTIFSKQISSIDQEVDPTTRKLIKLYKQELSIENTISTEEHSYHPITHYDSYTYSLVNGIKSKSFDKI